MVKYSAVNLQISEVHIHLGDVCMSQGEDEAGETHYQQAHSACLAARDLCPELVSDTLLREVEAMLKADQSDDEVDISDKQ